MVFRMVVCVGCWGCFYLLIACLFFPAVNSNHKILFFSNFRSNFLFFFLFFFLFIYLFFIFCLFFSIFTLHVSSTPLICLLCTNPFLANLFHIQNSHFFVFICFPPSDSLLYFYFYLFLLLFFVSNCLYIFFNFLCKVFFSTAILFLFFGYFIFSIFFNFFHGFLKQITF